jgi:hypothetical protein
MRIQLKDGTYEWIENNEQFARLVEQSMGEDAKNYVDELISNADYESKKLDTDLNCYEESCSDYESAANEMDDIAIQVMGYIRDKKRIDREEILNQLKEMHKVYCNNF